MASMISNGWPAATASPSPTAMLTIVPCIGAGTGTVPSGASEGACDSACCAVLPKASTASGSTASTFAPACRLPVDGDDAVAAAWK